MLIAGAVDLVQSTLPENSRQIGTVLSTFFHLSRGSFSGTESMCCAPRRSQRATRRRSSPSRAIIVLLGAAALSALSSQAEAASVTLIPSAAPAPMPPRTGLDSDLSAGATVVDLGSNFLERLGKGASSGFGRALRSNPDGGGASEVTDAPPYRAWGEGYGISAKTGPQLDFVGDR